MTAEVRSNRQEVVLQINDQELTKGQISNIVFKSDSYAELRGLQFTLENEGIEILDISSDQDINNGNIGVFNGQTTFSYDRSDEELDSEKLFSLVIKANADMKLSEALSINSRITRAEAYLGDGLEITDIRLEFDNGLVSDGSGEIVLHQNVPNPFSQNTVVAFTLPTKANVKFQIHDYTGKVIHEQKGDYEAGIHQLVLDKDILKTSGVYYYSLISDHANLTKSMIRIE